MRDALSGRSGDGAPESPPMPLGPSPTPDPPIPPAPDLTPDAPGGDSSGPSRLAPAPHRPQQPLASHPGDAPGRLRNNPPDEKDPPEQTATTTLTPHAFKTTSEQPSAADPPGRAATGRTTTTTGVPTAGRDPQGRAPVSPGARSPDARSPVSRSAAWVDVSPRPDPDQTSYVPHVPCVSVGLGSSPAGLVRGRKWRPGRIVPLRTRPCCHQNRAITRKLPDASGVPTRTILPGRQNRGPAGSARPSTPRTPLMRIPPPGPTRGGAGRAPTRRRPWRAVPARASPTR